MSGIGEELSDLVTTLRRLNATEMMRAADAAGLRSSLATDNITVFAPINAAFDALRQPTTVCLSPDTLPPLSLFLSLSLFRNEGPGLQNILRQSYDYLTIISYDNAKVTIDSRRTSSLQNILLRTQGFS